MNKKIKIAALSTVFSLCCMMFFSCSSSGNATVNISLNLPKNVSVLKSGPDTIIDRVLRLFSTAAMAAPEDVTSIAVQVSGPGMDTFEKSYPADTVKVTLAVESGADRKFVVKAYKADGLVWYAGTATVDLASGETRVVVITMRDTLRLVENLNDGDQDSSPLDMVSFNEKLYFSAENNTYGREIFMYDPGDDSVVNAVDIWSDANSSSPAELTVYGGRLFFSAHLSDTNNELCSIDSSNTLHNYEINASGSSSPTGLTVVDGKLFFAATQSGSTGIEPFVYDDTTGVPVQIANIGFDYYGSNPFGFSLFGDMVCFFAHNGSYLYSLYEYDESLSAPVYSFPDMAYTVGPSSSIALLGDCMYVPVSYNTETYIYRFDGSQFVPLSTSINSDGSPETTPVVLGGRMYFQAFYEDSGIEIWSYDGTDPDDIVLNENLVQVTDINTNLNGSSNPHSLTPIDGLLYFGATDSDDNTYLFAYNPDTMLPPIQIHQMESGVSDIRKVGSVIVFVDSDQPYGDVYIYDPARPVVEGVNPYALSAFNETLTNTRILMVQGNRLYLASNGAYRDYNGGQPCGNELWIYDFYK